MLTTTTPLSEALLGALPAAVSACYPAPPQQHTALEELVLTGRPHARAHFAEVGDDSAERKLLGAVVFLHFCIQLFNSCVINQY